LVRRFARNPTGWAGQVNDELKSWIPVLRRFARAATGGVESGDQAVRRCVERLLTEDPSGGLSREHAFHELARALGEVPLAVSGSGLVQLPLRPRLAFLLTRLEDMPLDEAARTLGLSPRRTEALIEVALSALREPDPAKVLIIEDEPMTALDLEEVVERGGHDVVGIAATHGEAVDLARAQPPALILADIRLADASCGIAAVQDISEAAGPVPAVYVTAFPEQALAEAGPGSVVVPKPFDERVLSGAIAEALSFGQRPVE
jgi:CheY-like chemotaxis protein